MNFKFLFIFLFLFGCEKPEPPKEITSLVSFKPEKLWNVSTTRLNNNKTVMGQSFQALHSGEVTQLKLFGIKFGDPQGKIEARIYSMQQLFPDQLLGTSSSMELELIPTVEGEVTFNFSNTIKIVAGTSYTLAVTLLSSTADASNFIQFQTDKDGDTYSSGRVTLSNLEGAPKTWGSDNGSDLWFEIIGKKGL